MTDLVRQALFEGTPTAVVLISALNNLISTDESTVAAYRERLPGSILLLLFLSAIVPSFLMGQQQGSA